jgi:hypothetical protein
MFIVEKINSAGQPELQVARLDITPLRKYGATGPKGLHLKLTVQVNSITQFGDFHFPIDSFTIRPGDFP